MNTEKNKTIFIPQPHQEISYPIGDNIAQATQYMRNSASSFATIKEFKEKNVNIFCRGSSGAVLAALFTTMIPNPCSICYVRKDNEKQHNSGPSNVGKLNSINIIIDDFVFTGFTIGQIYDRMLVSNIETVDCLILQNSEGIIESLPFQPKYFIHI